MPPPATKPKLTQLNPVQLALFKKNFPIAANAVADSSSVELTSHQLKKRAELKSLSIQEQEAHAEKERVYAANYRETHRVKLAIKSVKRRNQIFIETHGRQAFAARRRARYQRRIEREIKLGLRDPPCSMEEELEDASDCDPEHE
ncbi:hypothetical protein C8R47DRAFT_1229560 [Mycena vitilis]|nr:hypothetical protein C8R47DRAFT_1229560 [Mycena vitilis]